MTDGKELHKKNWIFHTMETKPDYMRSKPKRKKQAKEESKDEFFDV